MQEEKAKKEEYKKKIDTLTQKNKNVKQKLIKFIKKFTFFEFCDIMKNVKQNQ